MALTTVQVIEADVGRPVEGAHALPVVYACGHPGMGYARSEAQARQSQRAARMVDCVNCRASETKKAASGKFVGIRGVDPDLWSRAGAHAKLNHMDLGTLVNEALREYLRDG